MATQALVLGKVSVTVKEPCMTVDQIMRKYDKSHVYVLRALQRGWLKGGYKVSMQGTKVQQWVVPVHEVEAWRKSAEAHKSSKARFTGTARDIDEFQAWLKQAKIEDIEKVRSSLAAQINR